MLPDLIQQYVEPPSFLSWFWYSGVYPADIVIPTYECIRAEVFVRDMCKRDNIKKFGLKDLINLLLSDFVENIRLDTNLTVLLGDLRLRMDRIRKTTYKESEGRIAVTIYIQHDTLLRLQVLLRDLRDIDPAFRLSVRGLVRILVSDLVHEIKKGSGRKLADAISHTLLG